MLAPLGPRLPPHCIHVVTCTASNCPVSCAPRLDRQFTRQIPAHVHVLNSRKFKYLGVELHDVTGTKDSAEHASPELHDFCPLYCEPQAE
jgi:hypothetical protein